MRVDFDMEEYLDGYRAIVLFGTPSAVKALRTHPDYQPVQYTAWDTCEGYALECEYQLRGIGWSFAELDKYLCGLGGGDYEAEKAAQGEEAAYTDFCMTSPETQYSYLREHPGAEPRYYRHLCEELDITVNEDADTADMMAMIQAEI